MVDDDNLKVPREELVPTSHYHIVFTIGNMDEVKMVQEMKKSLIALSFVMDSMADDFDAMQESMKQVVAVTNSWKGLLRKSRT